MDYGTNAGDITIDGDPHRITVGEIAAELGLAPDRLTVDGTPVDPRLSLAAAGVARGSWWAEGRPTPPVRARLRVTQIAGPSSGGSVPIGGPTHLAPRWGRAGALASIDAPPGSKMLGEGLVTICGRPDERVTVGGAAFRVGPHPHTEVGVRPDDRGRIVVSPATPDPPPEGPELVLPPEPEPPRQASPPSLWGALPSGAMAVVGYFLLGPLLAILGGVAATVVVLRWAGTLWTNRRKAARYAADVADYHQTVTQLTSQHLVATAEAAWDAAYLPDCLAAVADGVEFPQWGVADVDVPTLIGGTPPHPATVPVERREDRQAHYAKPDRGGGVAYVGDARVAGAGARWFLLAVAAQVGPSARRLVIVTTSGRLGHWDWCRWLPHFGGIAIDSSEADDLIGDGDDEIVIVCDGLEPRSAGPFNDALGGHRRGVWLVAVGGQRPPARCTTTVVVDADGAATMGGQAGTMIGVTLETARQWARGLGRYTEPRGASEDGTLPPGALLTEVIETAEPDSLADVARRWQRANCHSLPLVLGVDGGGPVAVDLVADGPHALVAGTTGAGKSELLRTLVATAALTVAPERCSFVLIDFKGGGAFDAVQRLPHVAAVVTDLGPAEAQRALGSLRAEIRRREEVLRELGLSDLADGSAGTEGLPPRMVIVVDEFAALVDEMGDFVDGLLDVARRGRSLGVHLVLATQRPAGVVSGAIRANTNLRICLRVQDQSDSMDVIDSPEGARLARVPGRAIISVGGKLGGPCQIAQAGWWAQERRVTRPFVAHRSQVRSGVTRAGSLDELVDHVVDVAQRLGSTPASPPWSPPLPAGTDVRLAIDEGRIRLGWLDDPAAQLQRPLWWDPATDGLGLWTGPADTLDQRVTAVTVGLAKAGRPVYVVDGFRRLGGLGSQPGVGAVVSPLDVERLAALVRRAESGQPLALVVHGWSAVAEMAGDVAGGADLVARLERLIRYGSRSEVAVVVTGRTDRDVPLRISSSVSCRLIGPLDDPNGALGFGIKAALLASVGEDQFIDPTTGLFGVLALGEPTGTLETADAQALRTWSEVSVDDVGQASASNQTVALPLGLDAEWKAVRITVAPGRPLLIAGDDPERLAPVVAGIRAVAGDLLMSPAVDATDDELTEIVSGSPALVVTTTAALRALDRPLRAWMRAGTALVVGAGSADRDIVGPGSLDGADALGRAVVAGGPVIQVPRTTAS